MGNIDLCERILTLEEKYAEELEQYFIIKSGLIAVIPYFCCHTLLSLSYLTFAVVPRLCCRKDRVSILSFVIDKDEQEVLRLAIDTFQKKYFSTIEESVDSETEKVHMKYFTLKEGLLEKQTAKIVDLPRKILPVSKKQRGKSSEGSQLITKTIEERLTNLTDS